MSKPQDSQAAPVHFMQKERLRAEAAIDPDPVSTGEIGRAHV